MRPDGGHGRQRAVDGLAGDIRFDIAVGLAPPERRADALAELARDVGMDCPDWLEGSQDILPTDAVDTHLADHGDGALLVGERVVAVGDCEAVGQRAS